MRVSRRLFGVGIRRQATELALSPLETIIFGCQDRATGKCHPSYSRLRRLTSFCKQTVCAALRRLEAAGILRVVRRQITRTCPPTGQRQSFVATVQDRNLYAFNIAPAPLQIVKLIIGKAHSFPKPSALFALLWQPSLLGRERPQTGCVHR